MTDWIATSSNGLHGRMTVPGDKSVSHRAIMFGAIAEGITEVHGFLEGEDTLATASIFRQLGVRIDAPSPSVRIVHGVGLHGLRPPAGPLDCGNAGTAMRLLAGLLAGQSFDSVLVGDESLSRRPMRRVTAPLRNMGADIEASVDGCAPLVIHGGRGFQGDAHELDVASAQIKSAILLAGLYATGETRVREPHPTRDYTERMLQAFGATVTLDDGWITLEPALSLTSPGRIDVPADFSSAAFFLVAANVVPGSDIVIANVGINARRTGLLDTLRDMGADIEVIDPRVAGGEAVADLRVRHAPLRGIAVPSGRVPDMIDEFPALFAAAALAQGETTVADAAELRVKESDRIAVMARGLRVLGIDVDEHHDGAAIRGGRPTGGVVESAGDHRCAMAFAVLAQCALDAVRVRDCANVATSFPDFVSLAGRVGFNVEPTGTEP